MNLIFSDCFWSFNHMMNVIFFDLSRQPTVWKSGIMTMPEADIWRSSAEYMFWRAAQSFVIFLEEVFILNLNFLITFLISLFHLKWYWSFSVLEF